MRSREDNFRAKWVGVTIVVMVAFLFLGMGEARGSGPVNHCPNASGGLTVSQGKCKFKPFKKARLVNGKAIPRKGTPKRVRKVIRAANRIRSKPYIWGGGHGGFVDRGYDCSGAVSFALRGGRFIRSPMPSGPLMGWGKPGKGKWITVHSNPGHVYVVIAGLRFDTANTPGSGPRWSNVLRSTSGGFVKRNPGKGY